MLEVKFSEEIEDKRITFAVIAAKSEGKWVFCKHRDRETYEIPGGHREPGELILETAKRELYEETGATDYDLMPIGIYSVREQDNSDTKNETYGMLYYADIIRFGILPDFEIERIELFEELPERLTYPLIQPVLFKKVKQFLGGL
jgi:8-oxo-dGTP diphosphatase